MGGGPPDRRYDAPLMLFSFEPRLWAMKETAAAPPDRRIGLPKQTTPGVTA